MSDVKALYHEAYRVVREIDRHPTRADRLSMWVDFWDHWRGKQSFIADAAVQSRDDWNVYSKVETPVDKRQRHLHVRAAGLE